MFELGLHFCWHGSIFVRESLRVALASRSLSHIKYGKYAERILSGSNYQGCWHSIRASDNEYNRIKCFRYPIMASFGYTINEVIRLHIDFAIKKQNASASTRIHHDIKEAAYKGFVCP